MGKPGTQSAPNDRGCAYRTVPVYRRKWLSSSSLAENAVFRSEPLDEQVKQHSPCGCGFCRPKKFQQGISGIGRLACQTAVFCHSPSNEQSPADFSCNRFLSLFASVAPPLTVGEAWHSFIVGQWPFNRNGLLASRFSTCFARLDSESASDVLPHANFSSATLKWAAASIGPSSGSLEMPWIRSTSQLTQETWIGRRYQEFCR